MINKILNYAVLLYIILVLINLSVSYDYYQWDFRTYYYGAKFYAEGNNPFDDKALFSTIPYTLQQSYVYPPYTLWIFRIFTIFDYPTAYYVYLYLKCFLLVLLMILWSKYFIKNSLGWMFYLFSLLAFNSSLYMDFSTGNISIFEQVFLWTGFYFYLKQKLPLFCIMVLIASLFKITPIFFLGLLLFSEDSKKYKYLLGSVTVFLFFQLASFWMNAEIYRHFLDKISGMDERGMTNPSIFSLIFDIFEVMDIRTGWKAPSILPFFIYLAYALSIILISWDTLKILLKNKNLETALMVIFFTCLCYAVLVPRLKIYSYILLLVPTYWLLINTKTIKGYPLIILFLLLSTSTTLPVFEPFFLYMTPYFPIILAFIGWILFIRHIQNLKPGNFLTNEIH